ncbi:galactoside alpha-(1,2)-fucosyltransferase 2-like [Oratosquilla oratoria]|uniref:galactoside alpha-(1,2)-fucosyltransferase 2-like n=1 Tax=Oratosquilla oratoria TaxID=337810 RepID=UPI003F759294
MKGMKQSFVVFAAACAILCFLISTQYSDLTWRPQPVDQRRTGAERSQGENLFDGVDVSFLMNNVINCSRPFMMIVPRGQLGNRLAEASHMIAFKLKYKVQVGVRKDMYDFLKPIFPNFPLQALPEECTNRTDIKRGMNINNAENYVALNGLDKNIGIGAYPCHPAYFIQYRNLLRFFFRFQTRVQQSAERYRNLLLEKWRKKMEEASLGDKTIQSPGAERPVVIGVHIRRTSYIHHMKNLHASKVMEPIFFHDAFAFARKRYGKVAFIVVSDDLPWCRENVVRHHPDAVALDEPISRDEDLALMALSDHLIYGLGTFGFFGGLLAKGDIIYATNVSYDLTRPYEIESWVGEARHENLIPFHYRKPY